MNTTRFSPRQVIRWMRRHWIVVAVAGFAVLLVLAGRPVWAADGRSDISQTVPPPTPRPKPIPPGKPTPAPDDTNEGTTQAEPGAPASGAQPPAATGGAGAPASGAQPPAATGGAAAAPAVTVETGTVTAVVLNVRAGPGTDLEVLGKLRSGDKVTILGRSPAGDWLNVCCVPGTKIQGWVSTEYVSLDPVTKVVQSPAPTPGVAAATALVTTTAVITVTGEQQPEMAWQSLPITLLFTIEVDPASPAGQVKFRYEVPAGMSLIAVENKDGKQVTSKTPAGRDVITVSWPSLPARATEKVAVRLLLDEDLPAGRVLNSLVAVTARNGADASTGVVTSLPPATPPDFQ